MINPTPLPASSTLPPLPEGWYVRSFKVLAGSRLAIIGTDVDIREAFQSDLDEKTFGKAQSLAAGATARVWTFEDNNLIERVRFPLFDPFPIVEQFLDGRWLVTNARSHDEESARILGSDGAEQRRITLGDGINHIKIDEHQQIWVGWSDEGIYGNDDWHASGYEHPPSAWGIAAFDEHGAVLGHASLRPIDDCYALNISGDAAWACTYADFPIWEIRPGRERIWPTGLSGTQALAVSWPHVLAAGGYGDEGNRAALLRLDEQESRLVGEWRLPFGGGTAPKCDMIDGRADELHVVKDGQWLRWTVKDFVGLLD